MSHITDVLLALTAVVAATLAGFAPVSANNDPHRTLVVNSAPDAPAGLFCAFPLHTEFLVSKEYQTVSTLPDGSTVTTITGSLVVSVTNKDTSKTIDLNVSGPGSFTVSADGSTVKFEPRGLAVVNIPNLTQFGFPSNLVVTSGDWVATIDGTTGLLTAVSRVPHVAVDVCAALS